METIHSLDLSKNYTWSDYLSWQFDEMVEIIKGKVYNMSPAPRAKHQIISSNLQEMLYDLKKSKGKCRVFDAPFDVYFLRDGKKDTVVQPDICIICDASKIQEHGCVGAPDLIIEITSPSTIKKDLDNKFHLYQECGVKEYWIVIGEQKQVLTYFLHEESGVYDQTGNYLVESQIPLHIWENSFIDWNQIFQD